jgi:hypothetical protein
LKITEVILLPEQKSCKKDWLSIALVGATIAMAVFSCLLWDVNRDMAAIDNKLTNLTEEHYRYHPPNVSVISGLAVELYVYRNESKGTYLTIARVSKLYNSGVADDYGVVRLEDTALTLGNTIKEDNGERIDALELVECSGEPIPIPKGGPVVEIPLCLNFFTREILPLNSRINMQIGEKPLFEVRHPITKEILSNISALEHNNISYVMGGDSAMAEIMNGRKVNITTYYTEDLSTYKGWKKDFFRRHGATGTITIGLPSW